MLILVWFERSPHNLADKVVLDHLKLMMSQMIERTIGSAQAVTSGSGVDGLIVIFKFI